MPEHTPAPTPSRAVYGFAMFLSFRIFFILYLVWAIVPEDWFKVIGITCLPQRYWAVTVPIFLLTVLGVFVFFIYPNMGLYMTPNVNDLRTIRDFAPSKKRARSQVPINISDIGECSCVDKSRCLRNDFERNSGDFAGRAIPALQDLNIWEVSDHLYVK